MTHVAGHDRQLIRECDRGDPKVWFGEWLARLFQRRPKVAVGVCCDLVEGQHHSSVVNEVLDTFDEPGVATARRAVDQLAHRDGRGELTLSGNDRQPSDEMKWRRGLEHGTDHIRVQAVTGHGSGGAGRSIACFRASTTSAMSSSIVSHSASAPARTAKPTGL